ncbi:hypothetical protein [Ewingella americana]
MADIIDEANKLELLHIAAALASRKAESLQFIGRCCYCEDPLLNGNFCDSDCRDDHELEKKQKTQRRHAA